MNVSRGRSITWPMVVAGLMMVLGVALRLPVFSYAGAPTDSSFNDYIIHFMGSYSDIPQLYFRDQLWHHPAPYFGYALEYPVGTGVLIWLLSFIHGSVAAYFLATSIVMVASGLLVVWLLHRFDTANPWLLALAPALPLYIVLNWDMFGVMLMVAALLLLYRNRDGWGGLMLAVAVWTKFFPVVIIPLVLLDRVLRRRWDDALRFSVVFGIASLAINLPFALQLSNGVGLRRTWWYFFQFNSDRPIQPWSSNLWNLFGVLHINVSTQQINAFSALLLIGGMALTLLLMYYAYGQGVRRDLLLPSVVIIIGWFLFINKIYSPQYSLWLAVLLALVSAPPLLVAAFATVDLLFFGAVWISLYLAHGGLPAVNWVYVEAVWPAMILREGVTLVIIGWAVWRILRATARVRVEEEEYTGRSVTSASAGGYYG